MLVKIERIFAVPREPTTRTVSPGFSFTCFVMLPRTLVHNGIFVQSLPLREKPFRAAQMPIPTVAEMRDIALVYWPVCRVLCEPFSVLAGMEIRSCAAIRTFAGYRYIIHFGPRSLNLSSMGYVPLRSTTNLLGFGSAGTQPGQ